MTKKVLKSFIKSIILEDANVPFAKQQTSWTCGPASLRAVMAAIGDVNIPEDVAADISDADSRNGSSTGDLKNAFKKLHVPVIERDVITNDELIKCMRNGYPVILDVDMWQGEHWVVVSGYDGELFTLMDPSAPNKDSDVTVSPTALDGMRWSSSNDSVRGGLIIRT